MPDGLDTVDERARRPRPRAARPAFARVQALVAFLLEVAMLAAWAYAGFRGNPPLNFVLGIGLPLAVVVLWGLFFAPRAARRIRWPWLPLASFGMFAAAGVAVVVARQPVLGAVFIAVAFANLVASFWLRRRG
ncbi:YrdB family protein [Sinomonas sp. ASV322]|uniref:YrdB family protein n=1 Tax=Sinomonas sp. ASV322 TaxID=3041920 RepID=UPI0027DB1BC0|nr:YrdB family protein [Sinomonas sp. ASV322]MDQ4503218.1 YrdB family protein [Sinomonas sp. ASV322]